MLLCESSRPVQPQHPLRLAEGRQTDPFRHVRLQKNLGKQKIAMQHCPDHGRSIPDAISRQHTTHTLFHDATVHARVTTHPSAMHTHSEEEALSAELPSSFGTSSKTEGNSAAHAAVDDELDKQARAVELEAGFALDSLQEKREALKTRHRRLLSEQQALILLRITNPNSAFPLLDRYC